MVGVVIGRRAATRTSLASAVLGVAIFAPRTGRIAMITVIRSAISTGTAGCRSAMLTGRRIAPRAVAHAMAGVFVIRIAAVPAIGFAPVLTAGIFFLRAVVITMAAGIDRLRFRLAASARIASVPVAGASCVLYILENPCMTAAIRASAGAVAPSTVTFGRICP